MRIHPVGWFAIGFITTAAAAGLYESAQAQGRDGYGRGQPSGYYVTAQSRYGSQRVTGAVRNTPVGPQVQLPGGSWVYCKRSCAETLRAETVDFWYAQEGVGGQEQGLLRYIWPAR